MSKFKMELLTASSYKVTERNTFPSFNSGTDLLLGVHFKYIFWFGQI